MFGLLKQKKPYEEPAQRLYGAVLKTVREPVFYTDYRVPDTMDGRFDLLLLHVFFLVTRLREIEGDGGEFAQSLFDSLFADMDQTLRESGVGDMGIPKHMRRMMKAFNGRMHSYDGALGDEAVMAEVLLRNLYGTCAEMKADDAHIGQMILYIQACLKFLKTKEMNDFLQGDMALPVPIPNVELEKE